MTGCFSEAPSVLRNVARSLQQNPSWAPGDDTMTGAHRLLSQGGAAVFTGSLTDSMAGLPPLTWLRLLEAATSANPLLTGARATVALAALAARQTPVVLMFGGDEAGETGVAVGLPQDVGAIRGWRSDQAPDLIWEPGPACGWSVVADPDHFEMAVINRAVAHPLRDDLRPRTGQLTALGLLLNSASVLPAWSVCMVLRPMATASLKTVREQVGDLVAQAARRVTHTESSTDVTSHSVTDPRAERVTGDLGAWLSLIDDSIRSGGWLVTTHLCARSQADLVAVQAAFVWALGPDALGSQSQRCQAWDLASISVGAPIEYGWLSSMDLGDLLIPPDESVGSLQVRRPLAGGRQSLPARRPISLGTWLGTDLDAGLDVDDLAGHGFITGITGSGKSTTTRVLLTQLWNRHHIPFLVIDPAKADYREIAGELTGDLTVVTGEELRMNALKPWPGRPADRHVLAVSAAFRGAFGMPMPVPYVAAILFDELAARAKVEPVSLHDATARLDSLTEELQYRGEIKDNIRASLGLRLRLLLQPSRAERVAGTGAPTWLIDRPTVVQLSDLADDEERAFVASLLILYVVDAARARGMSASVQHVTVVEEAHRLMPEPRTPSAETGDPAAVSARLMTQLLAEVRSCGESLLVVDQSPSAVAREVLRNTNVKLVHRVVDSIDQEALGFAMGLSDDETPMLGSLGVGRCLISSRRLMRPQAAQIPPPSEAGERGGRIVGAPDLLAARCHENRDAAYHHASERHRREMETAVSAWAADGGSGDLIGRARQVVAGDSSSRPACLLSVGVRRHVATLIRLGHLDDEAAREYDLLLWAAATQTGPMPPHPSTGQVGPHEGCVVCPDACIVRGVVMGGMPSVSRAEAQMHLSPSPGRALCIAQEAAESCTVELSAHVSTDTAMRIGLCAAVHLSAGYGVSQAFLAAYRGAPSDE